MNIDKIQVLESHLSERKDDPFLLFALAKEHAKRDHVAQAINYFERLRREHVEYTGAYFHYVRLLMEQGQRGIAAQVFEEGREACRHPEAAHDLAELNGLGEEYELI